MCVRHPTFRGMVAENSRVCRSGRTLLQIDRTCCSNPRSSIRSASSKTSIVTYILKNKRKKSRKATKVVLSMALLSMLVFPLRIFKGKQTCCSVFALARIRSINRPGVAITTSAPALSSLICVYLSMPPTAAETLISESEKPLAYRRASEYTWAFSTS